MRDSRFWMDALALKPHPEGGYYRETYRSGESISAGALPDRYTGRRSLCTAIYFLLERSEFSAFHRIRSDEVWHFHDGGTLTLHRIAPDGSYAATRIGLDAAAGEVPQANVPAGCWFGATVSGSPGYTLVSCTVSPGFDFADFEIGQREDLLRRYPQHAATIERLTR